MSLVIVSPSIAPKIAGERHILARLTHRLMRISAARIAGVKRIDARLDLRVDRALFRRLAKVEMAFVIVAPAMAGIAALVVLICLRLIDSLLRVSSTCITEIEGVDARLHLAVNR